MNRISTDVLRQTFKNSRGSQVLGAVLVFQLLLASGLFWQSRNEAQYPVTSALVAVDAQRVDTVLIESGDAGQQLTLKRVDEGWQLDDDRGLPVDKSKVEQVLATLTDLSTGLPVATSTSAQAQLEVADDAFQRHIILKDGKQINAELYLGTSPGFRKAHVRKADDTAIYAAKVNVFDIPTEPGAWLDRQLLSFSDITSIEGDDFLIARVDDQWQIRQPEKFIDSHLVAAEVAGKLVSTLQSLRVTGLANAAGEAANASEEPQSVTLKVAMSDSPPLTLTLSKQADEVTVTRSDRSATFVVAAALFEDLQAVDAEMLLVKKPVEGEAAATQ